MPNSVSELALHTGIRFDASILLCFVLHRTRLNLGNRSSLFCLIARIDGGLLHRLLEKENPSDSMFLQFHRIQGIVQNTGGGFAAYSVHCSKSVLDWSDEV